jgi:hypothetical protein
MNKSILSLFVLNSLLFGADLIRNNNGVVTDTTTNLQWQDNTASVSKIWKDAIIYCNTLVLDNNSDWRLPNKNELLSLVDYSKYNPAIKENIFKNITSSYYWSSTTDSSYTSYAWYVHFGYGNTFYNYKYYSLYVRCVRGGQ